MRPFRLIHPFVPLGAVLALALSVPAAAAPPGQDAPERLVVMEVFGRET
jgi:hypothetical protein